MAALSPKAAIFPSYNAERAFAHFAAYDGMVFVDIDDSGKGLGA